MPNIVKKINKANSKQIGPSKAFVMYIAEIKKPIKIKCVDFLNILSDFFKNKKKRKRKAIVKSTNGISRT